MNCEVLKHLNTLPPRLADTTGAQRDSNMILSYCALRKIASTCLLLQRTHISLSPSGLLRPSIASPFREQMLWRCLSFVFISESARRISKLFNTSVSTKEQLDTSVNTLTPSRIWKFLTDQKALNYFYHLSPF